MMASVIAEETEESGGEESVVEGGGWAEAAPASEPAGQGTETVQEEEEAESEESERESESDAPLASGSPPAGPESAAATPSHDSDGDEPPDAVCLDKAGSDEGREDDQGGEACDASATDGETRPPGPPPSPPLRTVPFTLRAGAAAQAAGAAGHAISLPAAGEGGNPANPDVEACERVFRAAVDNARTALVETSNRGSVEDRAAAVLESLGMGLLKATRAFQVVGQGRPPLALANQLQHAERCVQELQQLSEAATEDWAALQEASSADSDTIIRQLRSRPPVTVEDVREVQARIAAVQRDLKAATQS
ncbi:unnamed protein product [Symbiodinium sp. KB8]|nr:unnamed protein product [Symbiodinium sp. KB8]